MKFKQIFEIIKEKFLESIKFSGIAFLISFFGAIGGSENSSKAYRRIGIPVTFFLCGLWATKFNLWVFTILIQHFILRLGHGIPSFENNSCTDEGSLIGRFFYKLFNSNETMANIFTRGFIAALMCVTFIIIPILKSNWFEYFYCSAGIILIFAILAWRNLGTYTFKIKNVPYYCCTSDVLCFGFLGIAGLKIIF
jgi:hypothetical protein